MTKAEKEKIKDLIQYVSNSKENYIISTSGVEGHEISTEEVLDTVYNTLSEMVK